MDTFGFDLSFRNTALLALYCLVLSSLGMYLYFFLNKLLVETFSEFEDVHASLWKSPWTLVLIWLLVAVLLFTVSLIILSGFQAMSYMMDIFEGNY